MDTMQPIAGNNFDSLTQRAYMRVLLAKARAVRFRFNGVEILMFDDREQESQVPKKAEPEKPMDEREYHLTLKGRLLYQRIAVTFPELNLPLGDEAAQVPKEAK